MEEIIEILKDNKILSTMIIFIILDTFLGCIRAIKEKKWNSCFGINGLLRKFAMIGSICFLMIVDALYEIDLIGFIPEDVMKYFGNIQIGISSLFSLLFILYEATSVLKNMVLCGLPIPAKIKNKVKDLLENFTNELTNKK